MTKRGLGVLLAALLALSLTACGGKQTEGENTSVQTENGGTEEAAETEKIVVPYMLTMNAAEEKDMVQEAINDITVDKIGVEVELLCIDFASWSDQMNLLLTDGGVDLFNCSFMSPVSTYVDN